MSNTYLLTEQQAREIWKAGQEYWKTSGASITFEELIETFPAAIPTLIRQEGVKDTRSDAAPKQKEALLNGEILRELYHQYMRQAKEPTAEGLVSFLLHLNKEDYPAAPFGILPALTAAAESNRPEPAEPKTVNLDDVFSGISKQLQEQPKTAPIEIPPAAIRAAEKILHPKKNAGSLYHHVDPAGLSPEEWLQQMKAHPTKYPGKWMIAYKGKTCMASIREFMGARSVALTPHYSGDDVGAGPGNTVDISF